MNVYRAQYVQQWGNGSSELIVSTIGADHVEEVIAWLRRTRTGLQTIVSVELIADNLLLTKTRTVLETKNPEV